MREVNKKGRQRKRVIEEYGWSKYIEMKLTSDTELEEN